MVGVKWDRLRALDHGASVGESQPFRKSPPPERIVDVGGQEFAAERCMERVERPISTVSDGHFDDIGTTSNKPRGECGRGTFRRQHTFQARRCYEHSHRKFASSIE